MSASKKAAPSSSREPEELVGFWINLASRTIVRVLDDRLKPLGFAMSHLPVLRALAQGGALSQKDLARIARVEQQTMAELLARMERAGLVEREQNPDDRRGSLTSLSRTARARFPKAAAALHAGERQAMTGFTDDEKTLFVQFLQRVVKNLDG
jgi:DNA-binding MarR family transcriptional regulator